ncbi:MAG: type II secretion system F family protein [Hyphomicrobiales bacterium]|nr:type II secretion system F family protein [Hyphomicrobiales bacterium]
MLAKIRNFAPEKIRTSRQLRQRLMQAGYFSPNATAYFFALQIGTTALVAALGWAATIAAQNYEYPVDPFYWILMSGFAGYLLPSILLRRKIKRNQAEHRVGFPDFMDLMVVCAQAGLSMEAAIQKIAQELKSAFPSLSNNLELTSLELRSGQPLTAAVAAMCGRLGIEEASSFATLLQQSEELGSSISESLRAYADDMRNKRLMKAEEKAYALPAKMVVPLTVFVFPVLIVVLLLPAVIMVAAAMK